METVQSAAIDAAAGEVAEQQFGVRIGDETQAGGVFQVDDEVADVVGHFDQAGRGCRRQARPGGCARPIRWPRRPYERTRRPAGNSRTLPLVPSSSSPTQEGLGYLVKVARTAAVSCSPGLAGDCRR